MHYGADPLLGEDPRQQRAIGHVAVVERHAFGHREAKTGRKVVDHRHRPAAVGEREHRVAADIAGAAGDEDGAFAGHGEPLAGFADLMVNAAARLANDGPKAQIPAHLLLAGEHR